MTQHELDKRMALEREVVSKLIEVAAKHGYAITKVDDGEERVKCSTPQEAIDAVFSVDESLMLFKHPDQPKVHCAFIVLGNDGHDAIADHSLGEGWDDVMAQVARLLRRQGGRGLGREVMVTRGWLKEQIEKYLLTINETHVEEWCVSNRDLADYVLGGFESFLFPDEAKEERRRHREELGYEP